MRPSVRPTRQPKGAIVIVEAEVITGEFAFSLLLLCETEREKEKWEVRIRTWVLIPANWTDIQLHVLCLSRA